jgi:penicillin amidase
MGENPPIYRLLLYPSSPIKIDASWKQGAQFDRSPYGGVEIAYDERGIPHVFAETEEAASFGAGYAQARDRLFQMEMLQRTIRGRLSEVVGEVALPRDRFWRKFGFEARGSEWLRWLKENDPKTFGLVEAYTEGVNFYLSDLEKEDYPLEFQLLGFDPSKFQPENVYFLTVYMNWVLSYREDDLAFEEIRSKLSSSLFEFYYPWLDTTAAPVYDKLATEFPNSVSYSDHVSNDGIAAAFPSAYLPDPGENAIGSNNWAIAAEKSLSGNAVLCNDPHLTVQLPSTFYEMHFSVNGKLLHGLTVAGAPMVVIGFNENLAWGSTNSTWDMVDFYELEWNEAGQYLLDGEWVDPESHKEVIETAEGKDVFYDFKQTYFGIIDTIDGRVLAVSWVATERLSNEGGAFMGLARAANIHEAYHHLHKFEQPPQNIILADAGGDVGLVTSGVAYIRDVAQRGIIKGTRRTDKALIMPMHAYTHELEPEKGWVASANQEHTTDSLSALLSSRFAASNRAKRIEHWMNGHEQLSVEQMKLMHQDIIDTDWSLMEEKINAILPEDLKGYFDDFDGSMDTSSVAATIFYAFKLRLMQDIRGDLGGLPLAPTSQHYYYLLIGNDSLPFPGGIKSSEALMKKSMDGCITALRDQLGDDPDRWKYGRYHQFWVRHLARIDALSADPFPANGNNRTLNVANHLPSTHGPSMRMIVEMTEDGPVAQIVLGGGQNGRFDSENYIDQLDTWRMGHYYPIALPKNSRDMEEITFTYNFGL